MPTHQATSTYCSFDQKLKDPVRLLPHMVHLTCVDGTDTDDGLLSAHHTDGLPPLAKDTIGSFCARHHPRTGTGHGVYAHFAHIQETASRSVLSPHALRDHTKKDGRTHPF